jgi:hypothetical protein
MTEITNKAYYFDYNSLYTTTDTLCLWEIEVLAQGPTSQAQIRKLYSIWTYNKEFVPFLDPTRPAFSIYQDDLLFTQENINSKFAEIVKKSKDMLKEYITIDTQNIDRYTRKLEDLKCELDKEYQDLNSLSKIQPPTINKEI